MRHEKQFFRLAALIAVAGSLACVAYWLYCQNQANEFREIWLGLYETYMQESGCATSSTGCSLANQIQEQLTLYGNYQQTYADRASLFMMLSWLIPFMSFSLFYSARWIITGTLFRSGAKPDRDEMEPVTAGLQLGKLRNGYLVIYIVALLGIIAIDCVGGTFKFSLLAIAGYIGGGIGTSLLPWLVVRFGSISAGFITLAFVLLAIAQSQLHLFGVVA